MDRELERQKRVIKRSGPITSQNKQSEILANLKEVVDKLKNGDEIEFDKAITDGLKLIDKSNDSELRIDWAETEDIGIVTHCQGNPFTGVCFNLYPSGLVSDENKVVNGLKHGLEKDFREDGQLFREQNYKNDELEGLSQCYNESGQLSDECNYKNGKKEGLAKVYHKKGYLLREQNYKNGELEGLTKWYYENGQLSGSEINPVLTPNTDIKTEPTASFNTTF